MFVHRLSRLRYSAYGSLAHQVSVSLFQPTARKNLATLSIRDKIRLRLQAKEQRIGEKSKKAVELPVEPEEPEAVKHKLFIGNLSYKTNSRALEEHLAKVLGYPMKAVVSVGLNGKSLGYSIVEFDTEDDAERAIELLNETELDSRRIFVHQDRAKDNLLDISKYVVVSNLPPQANWRLLKALFRPAGSVLVSRFTYDDKGNKGNTCFLSFHSAKHANSAVSLFHNTAYEENVLSVRLATEQDEFITLREPKWARNVEIDNLAEAVQWRVR